MKNDFEHSSVEFHNRAKQILLSLYSDFKQAVTSIDRQGNENVFQLQRHKYAKRLKHQLNSVANEMLIQVRPGSNADQANQTLSGFIEDYIHEFMQKTKSL